MITLHERMLPTSAGVESATSWSPVGWRIQMNHRGRRDRRDNRGDEREGQGRKRNRNESEKTEEIRNVSFRKKKNKKMSPPNPTRVVILISNTSSRHVLHLYQASSKYSVGYSCFRAETRNQIQTQEGDITPKVKKAEVVILVCDMSSGTVLHYYQVSSKYSKECLTYIADTKSMHNQCQI